MEKDVKGIFFVIRKNSKGEFYFTISNTENKVLMTSGTYEQKGLAQIDIDLIRFSLRNTFVLDYTVIT